MTSTCRIKGFGRVHITLLGMNTNGYRANGGLGFSLEEPSFSLSCAQSHSITIEDKRKQPHSNDELLRLRNILNDIVSRNHLSHSISIEINGTMPTHYGFGSGTGIRLAAIEALYLLNGVDITRKDVVRQSNRGGTSGIGINSYFDGGFVFDLGREPKVNEFKPSHALNSKYQLPLILSQEPMPNWPIGICIPKSITPKTEEEERDFFKRICPLPDPKVYETIYHSLFGVLTGIKECKFDQVCAAVKAIQKCAWKQAERSEYGESLSKIEHSLYAAGALAVGMSSLGPSLYFLADSPTDVVEALTNTGIDAWVFVTKARNQGRVIDCV